MQFEKGYIFHIYNQGNNRQKIFFNRENYLFFLRKIKIHITPYADIIAWCLMPNHFHLMVLVNKTELPEQVESRGATLSRTPTDEKRMSFNHSIGVMLASYTRAVNKQQNTSGTLFRQKTKAECVNCPKGITPTFVITEGITVIKNKEPEKQYPQVCFNYIHENPVKAKLVKQASDWKFSSARDYAGLRNGTLISRKLAGEYGLIF